MRGGDFKWGRVVWPAIEMYTTSLFALAQPSYSIALDAPIALCVAISGHCVMLIDATPTFGWWQLTHRQRIAL